MQFEIPASILAEHATPTSKERHSVVSTSSIVLRDSHLPSASVQPADAITSKSVKGSSSGPSWMAWLTASVTRRQRGPSPRH